MTWTTHGGWVLGFGVLGGLGCHMGSGVPHGVLGSVSLHRGLEGRGGGSRGGGGQGQGALAGSGKGGWCLLAMRAAMVRVMRCGGAGREEGYKEPQHTRFAAPPSRTACT